MTTSTSSILRCKPIWVALLAVVALVVAPGAARADVDGTHRGWARYYERWDALSRGIRPRLDAEPPAPFLRLSYASPELTEPAPSAPMDAAAPRPDKPRTRLHHELWFVTIELAALQTATLAIFANLPPEQTGWAKPSVSNIAKYAAKGPHFDNDRWGFNYVGHPLAGSEYYLIARNRKATWWQAFLYSAIWSAFWEYVSEGLYERASIQDLIVTPVAGSALGELRYQLRRELADPRTGQIHGAGFWMLAIMLDPIQSLAELFPLAL